MNKLSLVLPLSCNYSPIGLDIGAISIKMAQLQRTAKGWAVRDMLIHEIPVSDNENGGGRKEAVMQAIKEGMKKSSFSGRRVVSAMPCYQMDILPVKLSLAEDMSLEEAIIEKARQYLSYDLDNAVIDYIPVEIGQSASEKSARVLLMAARREDVDEHLSILKGAGVKPIALDVSACALSRLIGFSSTEKGENELIINAGELHTTITVLCKEHILLDRNILWGREKIAEVLMNRLKLDRSKADDLLKRVGLQFRHGEHSGPENERTSHLNKVSETVYEIVAPQMEKLVKEVDRVLQYLSSEMRGAAIDVMYLMGALSDTKDLDTYIATTTGITTNKFNPLSAFKGGKYEALNDKNGFGSFFGVALGLAMRGLENRDVKPVKK